METSLIMREALSIESRRKDQELMSEVQSILDDSAERSQRLMEQESERIFSLSTIEKICVRYRLRFLEIERFKGAIPEAAWSEISAIESRYKTKLRRLRIIAPGEFFEIDHIDKDPILFAELAPDQYLFIHKWGGEFSVWRKIQSFPFQSIKTGILSIVVLAALLSTVLAGITVQFDVSALDFLFSIFHFTIAGSLFMIFIALSFSIYPSKNMWKSKFLDF